MKSNNQASNLLKFTSKNFFYSENIKLKKDTLKELKNGNILKIKGDLKFFLKEFNAKLFFKDSYFYIKIDKSRENISRNKLKKNEFILKISYDFEIQEGIYCISKEPISAIIASKNIEYKAKIYFRDNFYIKIEG